MEVYLMRKILSIILALSILISVSAALATSAPSVTQKVTTPATASPIADLSFVDSMSIDDVITLRDYCNDIIAAASSQPIVDSEDAEPIEATRENPAFIGDRVLVDYGDAQLAVTIVNLFRAAPANAFAKPFNRYMSG